MVGGARVSLLPRPVLLRKDEALLQAAASQVQVGGGRGGGAVQEQALGPGQNAAAAPGVSLSGQLPHLYIAKTPRRRRDANSDVRERELGGK